MAFIYYRLIKAGVRAIEQVPEHMRAEVSDMLGETE